MAQRTNITVNQTDPTVIFEPIDSTTQPSSFSIAIKQIEELSIDGQLVHVESMENKFFSLVQAINGSTEQWIYETLLDNGANATIKISLVI